MRPRRTANKLRRPEVNILFTTTSRKHQRKQLVRYGLIGLALVVGLGAIGLGTHFAVEAFLSRAIYKNPRYALKQIAVEVKGGVQRKQVVDASRLVLGQNVIAVDLDAVEQNVERLPYVASAQVRRQLPDRIVITVTERLPIARLVSYRQDLNMNELFYVDRDGVAVRPQRNEPVRNLPDLVNVDTLGTRHSRFLDVEEGQRLDQPEVQAAVGLLKLLELTSLHAKLDVAQLDLNRPLSMELATRDGARILFRLDNLPEQLERLQQIVDYAENRGQQPLTVDLTPERNVPVRFRIASN